MLELAQRVPERSPPLKSTSTASALAMFRTLSVRALISSREYIGADYTRLRACTFQNALRRGLAVAASWRRRVRLRGPDAEPASVGQARFGSRRRFDAADDR